MSKIPKHMQPEYKARRKAKGRVRGVKAVGNKPSSSLTTVRQGRHNKGRLC